MAVNAACVWEVRSTATASNANGGFFKTGATGVDKSQSDTAFWALTGVITAGADAVLLHADAHDDMVGNGVKVVSGTNFLVSWYEVISVVAGASITLDRNCTSAAGAAGVVNIGGALSLGAANDGTAIAVAVAGNKFYIKSGAYNIGAATTFVNGAAASCITVVGYTATRDDACTGDNRPLINMQASLWTGGFNNLFYNLRFTGTNTQVITSSGRSKWFNVSVTNTSTAAGLNGFNVSTAGVMLTDCEFVSYRGNAIIFATAATAYLHGCYIHDSNIGVAYGTGTGGSFFLNCIFADNVTTAFNATSTPNSMTSIVGCTFYGAENKLGTAVSIAASAFGVFLYNNIFYGFITAITDANGAGTSFGNYNCLNNNTDNYVTFTAGANDITSPPVFTNVAQLIGSTASLVLAVLNDAGANFSSVTDGVDFCQIKSGTGVTVIGKFLISSHTANSLTLSSNPGSSAVADKVYQVTTGHDFSVGSSVMALGFPSSFQAGLSTSYVDIGAVQRKERLSTDPGISNVANGVGYTINDAALTGTLVSSAGASNQLSGLDYTVRVLIFR